MAPHSDTSITKVCFFFYVNSMFNSVTNITRISVNIIYNIIYNIKVIIL